MSRAIIEVGLDTTVKYFTRASAVEAELVARDRFPNLTLPMLGYSVEDQWIETPTVPVASHVNAWRPVGELSNAIRHLWENDCHHRDIHVGNIGYFDGHLVLLDWETVLFEPGLPYDLLGPRSGIPTPDIHIDCGSMYWTSTIPQSPGLFWGAELPDWWTQ